jgi:hypothetical protein
MKGLRWRQRLVPFFASDELAPACDHPKLCGEFILARVKDFLALDPQLICYSWMAGISDVALVVFVRKNAPEIQYLKTSIDEQQRREFGQLVETTVNQIEAGQFLPHSGIRFPQNGCVSCAHLGICLGDQQLVDAKLIRRPGASDLGAGHPLCGSGEIPVRSAGRTVLAGRQSEVL